MAAREKKNCEKSISRIQRQICPTYATTSNRSTNEHGRNSLHHINFIRCHFMASEKTASWTQKLQRHSHTYKHTNRMLFVGQAFPWRAYHYAAALIKFNSKRNIYLTEFLSRLTRSGFFALCASSPHFSCVICCLLRQPQNFICRWFKYFFHHFFFCCILFSNRVWCLSSR